MNIPFCNLPEFFQGELLLVTDSTITNVAIDSRSLQLNSQTLFFCIKGKNNDAHQYIDQLIEQGITNFVVSKLPTNTRKANYILVDNTLTALQEFAKRYREQFQVPIIGVTGSNGKTIVKEWLNTLLAPEYTIVKNPKSYNSQVGVPLSIVNINSAHTLGIFEAGISEKGEMLHLANIIQPTIGVLTNIGDAHNDGFSSLTEKITEKIRLFASADTIIYKYHPIVKQELQHYKGKPVSWSLEDSQATYFFKKNKTQMGTTLQVNCQDQWVEVHLNHNDQASIENSISCIVVMLTLGYTAESIQDRLNLLYPIGMRLNIKNGMYNTTIIDDSYISDFQSLQIALDFLEQNKQHQLKAVIFSDIQHSAVDLNSFYRQVAELFKQNQIHELIGIGPELSLVKDLFPTARIYSSTQDFLTQHNIESLANQTILVKGARKFRFEDVVYRLEDKTHQTLLEINLNSISHNLNYYRAKLKPSTKIMVMIKAYGYGSGSFEIAKLLEYHKVDYLGAAFTDEGIELRNSKITTPIIIMNPEPNSFSAIIKYNLEPEIYSIDELREFQKHVLKANQTQYPIHIKVDSGMHRLGFEPHQIPELIQHLKENDEFFEVKSIFSHFATSDMPEEIEFTKMQFTRFTQVCDTLKSALHITPICHIANTSAISNYPEFQLDMVRLGIGLYGVSNDEQEMKYLENVGTLKTVILQIKNIPIGESVGYTRAFVAQKPTRIATIPIGYADGIPRALGKGIGYVVINNMKAPIIGVICMDMMMVDITDIDCKVGDSVIIFGENPKVTEIAKSIGTIPYEILAGISKRVKRVFYRE